MKFAEINELFSKKVAEYLNKGYVLNPYTMSGHQGEIAKVDVMNGTEVVRIMLENAHSTGIHFRKGVALTVGRTTNERYLNPRDYRWSDTLWNNDLEIIEKHEYWQMQKKYDDIDWYIEGEAGIEAMKKTDERLEQKYGLTAEIKEVHFDKGMYRIALNMIRKTPFNKTKKLSDIDDFYMITRTGKRAKFIAVLKGKKIDLHFMNFNE